MSETLDPQQLIGASQQATGLTDFGEVDPRDSLWTLTRALNEEAGLTADGLSAKRASLIRVLCNRLLLQEAFTRNPRIGEETIVSPLVILGLPRSGTTKLHRMIAADPVMQKLPLWRLMYPVKALAPGPGNDIENRIAATEAFVDAIRTRNPSMFAAHPMLALEPDEEYFAMEISFQAQLNTSSFHTPSYQAWLDAQSFDNWYAWLKKYLQYVQFSDAGAGRPWVLKAPHHLAYLPLLFKYFPDATVIHCHREPLSAVASFCGLIHAARLGTSTRNEPNAVGRYSLDMNARRLERYLQDRAELENQHHFVDLAYGDIVHNARAAIARCYAAATLTISAASMAAMLAWEEANAQHKHGQHRYNLRDFGLAEAEVLDAFRDYTARFAQYLH